MRKTPPLHLSHQERSHIGTTQGEVWNALTSVSQGIYSNLDAKLTQMQADAGNTQAATDGRMDSMANGIVALLAETGKTHAAVQGMLTQMQQLNAKLTHLLEIVAPKGPCRWRPYRQPSVHSPPPSALDRVDISPR